MALRGAGGQQLAQRRQLVARTPERVLDLGRPEEVAMNRVVDVGARASVQVLSGVDDLVSSAAGPPLRYRDLSRRLTALGEPPASLPDAP